MSDCVQHAHCDSCFWRKCTTVTDPPCAIIACSIFCGAAFHKCKESEHRTLCPLEKVPCLNVEYGCPMVLRRCDLGKHLAVCPASVVCCTMEWCRWPMYSRERGTRVPFAPSSLRARCTQLDVALAMRDQRMLDRAKWFPRRSLVRTLRNSFTKHYPAVPLLVGGNPVFLCDYDAHFGEYSFSESEEEDGETYSRAPWLTAKKPPGLQKSILGELFSKLPAKSRENVSNLEDVRCALCPKAVVESPANGAVCQTATSEVVNHSLLCSDSGGKPSGTVCSHAESEQSSHLLGNSSEILSIAGHSQSVQGPFQTAHSVNRLPSDSTDMQETCDIAQAGDRHLSDVSRSVNTGYSVITDSYIDGRDVETGAEQKKIGIDHVSGMNRDCWMDTSSCPADRSFQLDETWTESKIDGAAAGLGTGASVMGAGSCPVDDSFPSLEQCLESLPLTLHEVLAVDLNIEVCSRYHIRDPSLYSFICAQLFRRDEYSRHARDVHSVIHDAMDHWLEVRCPLAHCGCTFSMHRRLPSSGRIIFSPLLESIGLRRTEPGVREFFPKKPTIPLESSPTISGTTPTVEAHPMEGTDVVLPVGETLLEEATEQPKSSPNRTDECCLEIFTSHDFDSPVSVRLQPSRESTPTSNMSSLSVRCAADNCGAGEPARSVVMYENGLKECTPEMFTSREFDSAVCLRPRTSKEPTPNEESEVLCLTDLPRELLSRVATFLDPFSLCNLSLTSWLLRDVCRGLLKQRGLVVLEWTQDRTYYPRRWKVLHQVSLSVLFTSGLTWWCIATLIMLV